MECREAQRLLTAFHDGELPEADRTRVEHHLRGCPECGRLLADLARADEAAGVPDPGPAYWDRFNARVAERIEREAEGPGVTVLRPKPGWVRQQLRYLVPAVAAAALVVVIVRFGGQTPVAPTRTRPPAESVPELSPSGRTGGAAASRPAPAEPIRSAEVPAAPPATVGKKRLPIAGLEGRNDLADRLQASRHRSTTAGTPPAPAAPAETPGLAVKAETAAVGMIEHGVSPCETARTLAAKERFLEAEAAQRECLGRDPSPPAQEQGLLFLAELLDRQARFDDADAVLAEVHRQFPDSHRLDLYRQQRPTVQKQAVPAPAAR